MSSVRRISIFGATGSVGQSTLDLIDHDPENYDVVALTANRNADALAQAARRHCASIAVVADESAYAALKDALAGTGIEAAAGAQALVDAARLDTDWTMAAIVGCAGLPSTLAALAAGRTVALANTAALVSAGALMMQAATASGAMLVPVYCEHNAIFHCTAGARMEDVQGITLSTTGGTVRSLTRGVKKVG